MINGAGNLIGINTAILSGSGGNQGIGFGVPVNMAKNVMDQIVKNGKVTRAFLGVSLQEVTPDIAESFKLEKLEGALIGDVSPNSPASRAGLKPGDIVLELNGKPVIDARALKLAIGAMQPGSTVTLKILRDGQHRDVSVTLGEQPPEQAKADTSKDQGQPAKVLDGVEASTTSKGVVITNVSPGSPAAEVGLTRGDVILEVNRKPVKSVEQFEQFVRESGDKPVVLFVNRGGHTQYVVVPK